MMEILEGLRVADFSHVMAGPYATHLLRLLGAEVIKIEPPGRGDAMRTYGADRRYDGMAPAFIAVNSGKKSIMLDLKNPADLETARQIVAHSDVMVENFRPVVMAVWASGGGARKLNPRLVTARCPGTGIRPAARLGPDRQYRAGDQRHDGRAASPELLRALGFPVVDTPRARPLRLRSSRHCCVVSGAVAATTSTSRCSTQPSRSWRRQWFLTW